MSASSLLVVCGLAREAALVPGRDFTVVMSGGRRAVLERQLADIDPAAIRAVVSFGLAGALDPALRVGDLVVPQAVCSLSPHAGDRTSPSNVATVPTSPDLPTAWGETATPGLAIASRGAIAGVDVPVLTVEGKRTLRDATGAVAVDMESHVAAAWAARHDLPFAVLRVVSDPADGSIPPAAVAAMREDGGIDAGAALRSILREPSQIPALIRVARDGAKAFRALGRAAACLNSRP